MRKIMHAYCEACWVGNVMCDQAHCKWTCLQMVLSGQRGRNREGDGRIVDCLLCNERMCGPALALAAGLPSCFPALLLQHAERELQVCLGLGVGGIDLQCGCERASSAGVVPAHA